MSPNIPGDLPKFKDIGKATPDLTHKFFEYNDAVFADAKLTRREKSLIALAVAHTIQCPYCIEAYTNTCLKQELSNEQMSEAVHVAVAIRGCSSLAYSLQMQSAINGAQE